MFSPRLKFKVLTKFLSASNQIVKDLDLTAPASEDAKTTSQPRNLRNPPRFRSISCVKRKGPLQNPGESQKISFLLKELTGGCYHRRARSEDSISACLYSLLPP